MREVKVQSDAPFSGLAASPVEEVPSVSMIVLCRNERDFIAGCLDSLVANTYPKDRLEVLVADGMSEDGTRSIVESYAERYPFIRLIDNPKRIPATAANEGIKVATGDFVMIAGAHAIYPQEYVRRCVGYSHSYPTADNVGGVRLTVPRSNTVIGRSIAYVSSHRFGAGTASYHRGRSTPGWVDSVWGGCYRRKVFEKCGLYNEALRVGEDREFNQRLRERGGRVLLAPEIKCIYYARSKFIDHCRWAFRMGFWPFHAGKLVGRSLLSARNFVPLAFVLTLFVSLATAWCSRFGQVWLLGLLCSYFLASVVSSAALVQRERDPRYLFVVPLIFAATHVFYGIGSLHGIAKPVLRRWTAPETTVPV